MPNGALKKIVWRYATILMAGPLLLAGSCSFASGPWRHADDFLAGLQCDMTSTEIRAYSSEYWKMEVSGSHDSDLLVARYGNTQVSLWLQEGRLTLHQLSWTYPPTNFASRPKIDLCTGEQYVELRVIVEPALVGAYVWLDGNREGQLVGSSDYFHDVSVGSHQLRIEKEGLGAWSTKLHYDSSSSGIQPLVVKREAFRDPDSDGH